MKDYSLDFSLQGKTVFIAGGAGLLGGEISKAMASAGADVVILDIDKEKASGLVDEIVQAGHKARYEKFDITDIEHIQKKISQLVKKYGPIHAWVNSAYPRTDDWGSSIENLKVSSWRKNVDMHLSGYFFCCKEIGECMKKQHAGSIINLASIYGVVGPDFSTYSGTDMTLPAEYSAIKGGIINFSRYLASYFGKYNIRVNSICPGGVLDGQDKVFVENYSKKTLLGRMASPEDVAGAAIFLASDAASYVTGTSLMVDGGWTAV